MDLTRIKEYLKPDRTSPGLKEAEVKLGQIEAARDEISQHNTDLKHKLEIL